MKIEWKPNTITIEQRGRGSWDWEVKDESRCYVKSGTQFTKRGAIRRAKRYRKGVLT